MIIITESNQTVWLPKLERYLTDCCNIYYMILQNNLTKDLWLFRLRDYASHNPIRFRFEMEMPDSFRGGEYTYYVIGRDQFDEMPDMQGVSTNYPAQSRFYTDKATVSNNGLYLVSGDTMLVLSRLKSKVTAGGLELATKGYTLIATETIEPDYDVYGQMSWEMNILGSGLLKYETASGVFASDYEEYDDGDNNTFIQYMG